MYLQDLFKDQINEQMPGVLRRMTTGLKAMTGNPRARGEAEVIRITRDLANKIQRWAGTVGGLTVSNLRQYQPYQPDKDFQTMLNNLEITFGPEAEIDDDAFDDALLDYVRTRARKAGTGKAFQATRGVDTRTAEILQSLNDAQLMSWVKRARDNKMDETNAVLVAAVAELARRGIVLPGDVGSTIPLDLGGRSAA